MLFKQDQLKLFETNIVFTGCILKLKIILLQTKEKFWILSGHKAIDLLKIYFNGVWSLIMVNLRP